MINLLIVAGGRDFTDAQVMSKAIAGLTDSNIISEDCQLVCGMAKGADMTAYDLYGALPENCFKADWKDMTAPCVTKSNSYGEYNALAGMKRNHAMGDHAEGLVAFWDGKSKGTSDMITYMKKLGKPVYIFDYEGKLSSHQPSLFK